MFLTSYIFKSKAVRALKGNWQTALIVSFIAGLPATLQMVLSSVQLPVLPSFSDLLNWDAVAAFARQIPAQTVWVVSIAGAVSFIITPVLTMGSNYYFIKRLQGEDLGVLGVLSRRKLFFRALLLSVLMAVRIFLWGLLFIVPGYIASLRYSMAPYFLAEDPDLTPTQAIEKSKAVMADKKLSYFVLLLSFIGWWFMANFVQIMLISFGPIIALVAAQFVELFRITYTNASVSAFYLAASRAGGIADAKKEADAFMRQIGARMPGGGKEDQPGGDGGDKPDSGGEDQE